MVRFIFTLLAISIAALALYSCHSGDDSAPTLLAIEPLPQVDDTFRTLVSDARITNLEASIPPQCYTKTESVHNPCYTCHQNYDRSAEDRLNSLDDGYLQGTYNFSEIGVTNHWKNLFVDRTEWLAAVSDEQILDYINTDNYSALASQLTARDWQGFLPDLANYHQAAAAFDEQGLARDGSHWVAFNYKPFPGTFWPTNGSTDDVVLRLPKPFRELNGVFNKDVYFVNLTLVELTIKQLHEASIWPVDEAILALDLDGNGALGSATKVQARAHYVGDARDVAVMFQQFPQGTELMHSVRYVGVEADEQIVVPPRMKELRYMRKVSAMARDKLDSRYADERKEKRLLQIPAYIKRGDEGLDNALGWYVQGFIEDYEGELRPQTYEETVFCMGCHKAIGTTIDSTFAFARKVTGAEGWKYIDLHGMPDAPSVSEPGGEILNYLQRAGGGSEFRENPEMVAKWFLPDGSVDEEKIKAADVYTLLAPGRRRALDLNKAYSHIVRHQSYIQGRDASVSAVNNVLEAAEAATPPLDPSHQYQGWDIRLDWSQTD